MKADKHTIMIPPSKKKKRLLIALISIIIIVVLGIAAFIGIQFYIVKYAEPYFTSFSSDISADAALVLGAKVNEDGTPSLMLQDRLDCGYELYQSGQVQKIIISGDHEKKGYDEVNCMKEYLLEKGVPREDLFLDHAGLNTYDSLYRAKHIFQANSVIVATQRYHMYRAIYIGRKIGLETYGVPMADKPIYDMWKQNIRESLARVKAILDTDILKRQSTYLGDPIPVSGDGSVTEG